MALRALQDSRPDVLISNLGMPEEDDILIGGSALYTGAR